MSAAQYGARLLEEVHEESLDKFLADIRRVLCPQPRSVLGVPQLDTLLEASRYPVVIASQRPTWHSPAATSPAADEIRSGDEGQESVDASPSRHESRPQTVKARPATIELTSNKSATGKTTLLSLLTAISVLPKYLGGKGSTAVYIDADGRFSATRTMQIMQHYIRQQTIKTANPTTPSDLDMIIREALNHIHIFRPQSSTQVLSLVTNLSAYLLDHTGHQSIHRPLGLIVIDSATTFHWQDRFDRTIARLDTPGSSIRTPSTTNQIIQQLKVVQDRFECAVLLSTTSFLNSSVSTPLKNCDGKGRMQPTTPAPDQIESAASPWTAYATLTLFSARVPVPQFATHMSLEECLRDRERRFEAMSKGRFVASAQSRKSGEHGSRLGFRINAEGVEFE